MSSPAFSVPANSACLLIASYRKGLVGIGLMLLFSIISAGCTADEGIYTVEYTVELQPDEGAATVTILIDDARLLRKLDFKLNSALHSDIQANGQLEVTDDHALWIPPEKDAQLSLRAKISHQREDGEFDARVTEDWAIFRGDDLVPPARVTSEKGAKSRSTLTFKLPADWLSVNTGWDEVDDGVFRIDNPERRFDRPTGWMIAGKLGTRRDLLGNTHIAVSAPQGTSLHRMDILSFLNFVWPELNKAFGQTPPRLLIVGAGDPMWRGGLSASNSLFLHSDRPLVSENGTSPLIHELVHMVTSIQGAENHDWIAEGLAEFYAIELLYRAGGMTESRRDKVFEDLSDWSEDVKTLLKQHSTGATTARATVFFNRLDQEIRTRSGNRYTIDDLARQLMGQSRVSLNDLREAAEALVGEKLKTLRTPLLQ